MGGTITAIIKPTNRCNLACSYCYVEASAEPGDMSDETLERVLRELGRVNFLRNPKEPSHIIWHGGEPLLRGVDFFEKVAYVEYWLGKESAYRFQNGIQTNGTLLTKPYLEALKRHHFSLGFSLDGPSTVNDLTRKFKDGRGAFESIAAGLALTRQARMGSGVIVVVSQRNIGHLDEIFDFLKENKLGSKINPLIRSGRARDNYEELGITPEEYGRAMIHLFDRYFSDDGFKPHMDPFDTIMGNVATGAAYGCCTFGMNCQQGFVSIGPQGDVYPCGRFDGIAEFNMGNINECGLDTILAGPVREQLLNRRYQNIKACQACEYVPICHSGCLNNGYMSAGDFMAKDYYCLGYKLMFAHITDVVKKELSKAKL